MDQKSPLTVVRAKSAKNRGHRPVWKGIVSTWMIMQTFGPVSPAWSQKNQNTLTYGELLEKIEQGKVKKVEINPSLQQAAVT
ncbi:MAG: cell division protein FtsH, partial [Microcystis sp.]